MHASSGFDHAATTNQIARAASPPTLARNARMGHPRWEWCNAKTAHTPFFVLSCKPMSYCRFKRIDVYIL